MSTDNDTEPSLERTPEEKMKALLRRTDISEETQRVAKRSLKRRQEGSL